jgi:uncharacterized coiled-coil DUF342 family protein
MTDLAQEATNRINEEARAAAVHKAKGLIQKIQSCRAEREALAAEIVDLQEQLKKLNYKVVTAADALG